MLENLLETQKLFNDLMKEHGLTERGWKFGFSSKKTAVASCKIREKKIVYSKWFVDAPLEAREQSALHEIAHALVYEEAGIVYKQGSKDWHGRLWRKKMLEIGARPERCADDTVRFNGNYNYLMECRTEGCEAGPWRRHRMTQRAWYAYCPNCGSSLWVLDLKTGDIYETSGGVSHHAR